MTPSRGRVLTHHFEQAPTPELGEVSLIKTNSSGLVLSRKLQIKSSNSPSKLLEKRFSGNTDVGMIITGQNPPGIQEGDQSSWDKPHRALKIPKAMSRLRQLSNGGAKS